MTPQSPSDALTQSLQLLDQVCRIAHPTEELRSTRSLFATGELCAAIRTRDTPAIFDWLMTVFSYQGVADSAVDTILKRDGNITWQDIEASLRTDPACCKLRGFWRFSGCAYEKNRRRCAVPSKLRSCPLPRHNLRNGRLNQTAYSLYFFMRDVADGDFVGWLERQIAAVRAGSADTSVEAKLIAPLRAIYGVSDKVISMALSDLLLAGRRPAWRKIGSELIVIDRLVHNFMHRSGLLKRHGCEHGYGTGCYGSHGCAALLNDLARGIDMRRFHRAFPQPFPRFVQIAIWRFCAAGGENICNGNQIDDAKRCQNEGCNLQRLCARIALRKGRKSQ